MSKKLHAFNPSSDRAFTLVELLVVIGIIALLVSILMPALAKARQQAVRVKCAAHLSQIGAAVTMYANDHKGAIPVAYMYPAAGWPRGYHWCDHLAPYLQHQIGQDETAAQRDRSILWGCPAWDGRVDPMPNEYWGRSWKIGYGYNVLPRAPLRPYESRDVMAINPDGGSPGRYFKLSEVDHHSDRGLITDAFDIYVGVPYPWDPSVSVQRQQYSCISPTRHGSWGSVAGCNVLYFDAHVGACSAREAYYAFGDPIRSDPP